MKEEEFYIGYVDHAPPKTSATIRRVLWCLFVMFIACACVLVLSQHKFLTNTFEYGRFTTVEGYLFSEPVEYLAVSMGKTDQGEEVFQNILLVGEGKANAKSLIKQLENRQGNLQGIKIALKGFLIYGGGKGILQVTEVAGKMPDIKRAALQLSFRSSAGETTINGEVVDPKCYFGVMKPGAGKSHRSCAIRCISGGIPPIFHSSSSQEDFLLFNEHVAPINEAILPYVGDYLSLTGEVISWNDWKILKVNTTSLQQLAQQHSVSERLAVFEKDMTFCSRD